MVVWGLAEGMAIAASWDLLHGNPPTTASSWRLVSPRAIAVAVGYALKWILIVIGLFLLIAPGFYLIGRWFAVPTTSVLEQASMREAFQRSRDLVELDLRRVLSTLGLVEMGTLLLVLAASALLPGGLESSSIVQILAVSVVWIVLLPFRAGLMTLLYLEIRMRREGYDLATTLQGLPGAA